LKNLMDLMKKARQMQATMARVQEEMASRTVEGEAGGGAVMVTLTGAMEAVKVRIDPAAIDPADPETLEDLVRAAFNQASSRSRDMMKEAVARAAGGMPLPPGLF
jgi:DNA-binding YbaB/EbfC family protein